MVSITVPCLTVQFNGTTLNAQPLSPRQMTGSDPVDILYPPRVAIAGDIVPCYDLPAAGEMLQHLGYAGTALRERLGAAVLHEPIHVTTYLTEGQAHNLHLGMLAVAVRHVEVAVP